MWFKYFLLILVSVNALLTIALIGEERKPYTKANAVFAVLWGIFMIWGILTYFHA